MNNIRVAVFVGSLRKASFNRRLAYAVEKMASANFEFKHMQIDDLPLYSQELDGNYPPAAERLKADVLAADSLLFVTPEYNRSMPGVLKNAIDIASRPRGKSSFTGKPAAVLGTSPGAMGTVTAQQHLRISLGSLNVFVMPQPEVALQFKEGLIDESGNVSNEGTREFLRGFVARYEQWVGRFVGG